MPIIPSSAYGSVGQITALVRSLMNDAKGNVYSDTVLLPYVQSAYRTVYRKLENIGQESMIADNVTLIVPAVAGIDPSLQVSITDATAPPNQLPVDMIVPAKIWERPASSSQSFVEMFDLSDHSGLPSVPQGQTLIYWEWRSDGLYFIGALQDTQIRLRYVKSLADVTSPAAQVLLRNVIDAVAFITAALAGTARGSPLAEKWDAAAQDALFDLKSISVRRDQRSARRRRPFGRRSGSASWSGV